MNTIVTIETEFRFDAMYNRVAKGGIKHWEKCDDRVVE